MEQPRCYGSISRASDHEHYNHNGHHQDKNKNEGGNRLDISLSSCSYQEYDMTYLVAPKLSFSQKMERCFRFTVPLLIGALFLWAAGMLFSSSAVRCGGYPTDPKFCFQKDDDIAVAQTINANNEYPFTANKHDTNVSAATSIHATTTVQDAERSVPSDTSPHLSLDQNMCFQNSACHNLGLQGECCPTTTGVYLGCCSSFNTEENQDKSTTLKNYSPSKGMSDEINPSSPSSSPSCELNPKCHSLGVIGDCCPTSKGIQLSCCHS